MKPSSITSQRDVKNKFYVLLTVHLDTSV